MSYGRLASLALVLATLGACGDDSTAPGGSGGGGAPTGSGGGEGGQPFASCSDCIGADPICVDEAACAAGCPAGRSLCDAAGPSDDGPWEVCCDAGATCCPGNEAAGSFCIAAGASCPVVCPDGSTCPTSELCQLDPPSGSYGCVATAACDDDHACGDQCCPFGSRCEGGTCPLPDLSIDEPFLIASTEVTLREFSEASCSLAEGCVGAAGIRKLLRFSLKTPNTGDGDLFLGNPAFDEEHFQYSECHDHYHFNGYAQYRLLDANNQVAASGHKQAFCLLDFAPLDPDSNEQPTYNCGFQGISRGWSDIYERILPCQWVDITGVAGGDYQLEISVNFEETLAETDYDNNFAIIPVTIEPDSCAGGCRPVDVTCCADGDPCGWGADGSCDCGGLYDWDQADCQSCLACDIVTSCVGGCTAANDPCCDAGNSCDLAGNDVCDCAGTQDWDAVDCLSCISSDPECADVNTCPEGCSSFASQPQCCGDGDPCGYANDGWCDCSAQSTWDFADCSNCTTAGCPN